MSSPTLLMFSFADAHLCRQTMWRAGKYFLMLGCSPVMFVTQCGFHSHLWIACKLAANKAVLVLFLLVPKVLSRHEYSWQGNALPLAVLYCSGDDCWRVCSHHLPTRASGACLWYYVFVWQESGSYVCVCVVLLLRELVKSRNLGRRL